MNLLSYAIEYAKRRFWPVFPVNGKVPFKGTQGFKDATRDEAAIAELWKRHPNANVAVATGAISGLVVIDADSEAAEVALKERGLVDVPTLTSLTGRGKHWFFKHPGGVVRSRAGILPHTDVRGDGGYVVLPPSLHPERGRRYEWMDPNASILSLPEQLAELLRDIPVGERNDTLFRYAFSLRRDGFGEEEILARIAERNRLVCSTPLDERELAKIARSAARYDPDAMSEVVRELNKRYANVILGDREAVIEESIDASGSMQVDVISVSAFRAILRGHTIDGADGKPFPIGSAWLGSPDRRFYRRMEFAPPPLSVPSDTYNLFRGWPIEPRVGDWSLFKEHIRENICQNNEESFRWVMSWMAQMIQQPAIKPGTALALRGKQGVGKSKFGDILRRLLGPYHFAASSPHQVVGRFNAQLARTILLQAEEAFWAGSKIDEGTIKDIITSLLLRVEFKGKDIVTIRNCIRLLVTSNAEWVVPKAYHDRRFTVLDVGERRIRDFEFFAAMDAQMEEGGYHGLLKDLLEYSVEEAFVRSVLDTAAGREQKSFHLEPVDAWLVDLATFGVLTGSIDGEANTTLCELVYGDYVKFAQRQRQWHIMSASKLGQHLARSVPGILRQKIRLKNGRQKWRYAFPPLADLRNALHERLPGLDVQWDPTDVWEHDQTAADVDAEEF